MTKTWYSEAPEPEVSPPSPLGWLRVGLRALALALIFGIGLLIYLGITVLERPFKSLDRPVSKFIKQGAFRLGLAVIGLRLQLRGQPMRRPGAQVANHCSWLDIFVLNARDRVDFVSKDDVAGWPGIGLLARSTGTVFIGRDPRQAAAQRALFEERLLQGHRLMFFPEGTTSDGQRLLPFKSTLFAAFFSEALRDALWIQPVSVRYLAPKGADPRYYGWWGTMTFGGHGAQVLSRRRQGTVIVTYHAPLEVAAFADRKALARAAEAAVSAGHAAAAPPDDASIAADR